MFRLPYGDGRTGLREAFEQVLRRLDPSRILLNVQLCHLEGFLSEFAGTLKRLSLRGTVFEITSNGGSKESIDRISGLIDRSVVGPARIGLCSDLPDFALFDDAKLLLGPFLSTVHSCPLLAHSAALGATLYKNIEWITR